MGGCCRLFCDDVLWPVDAFFRNGLEARAEERGENGVKFSITNLTMRIVGRKLRLQREGEFLWSIIGKILNYFSYRVRQ